MLKTRLLVSICMVCLFLLSCTNPYQTARSTVTILRGTVAISQTGFETYVQVETDKCKTQCKEDPTCLTKCLEPVRKNTEIFQKSQKMAVSSLDEADALINVAEKLGKKESVEWMIPLKGLACMGARGLDFLPKAAKEKIQGLINILGNFGCPPAK